MTDERGQRERSRAGHEQQLRTHPGAGAEQAAPAPSPRNRAILFGGSVVIASLAIATLVATLLQPAPQGDPELSASIKSQRVAAFQAHGVLHVPVVTDAERESALNQMALPATDRDGLEKDLSNGRTKLAWVTLWDDLEEDGDVVELSGAGFTRSVTITHLPQRFAVPVNAGRPLTLTGIRDGGGGITVAADADGQPLLLPVMNPGEAVTISLGVP